MAASPSALLPATPVLSSLAAAPESLAPPSSAREGSSPGRGASSESLSGGPRRARVLLIGRPPPVGTPAPAEERRPALVLCLEPSISVRGRCRGPANADGYEHGPGAPMDAQRPLGAQEIPLPPNLRCVEQSQGVHGRAWALNANLRPELARESSAAPAEQPKKTNKIKTPTLATATSATGSLGRNFSRPREAGSLPKWSRDRGSQVTEPM